MALPVPQEYSDWRDFASALLQVLQQGDAEVVAGGTSGSTPTAPAGYSPIWINQNTADLYEGNVFGSAPTAPDIVFIDTANIADAAIQTAKIGNDAVTSVQIANLAVLTAKIADAAIVSAKIGDLQVVTAKIADLAVNNAKIANLAVGTANIMDAAINNAKIGNLAVGTANIIDLSVNNAKIAAATITTAKIGNAQITNALIANLAVGTAQIQNAAIGSALIADAAIITAKIADAAIISAKIANLVIDKITAGTLNAVIDMGTGLIRFTIGSRKLVLGKGFGTSNQFIMWFGPIVAENTMTEAAATFYLKSNGDAYFGGSLFAGLIRNALRTNSTSATASVEVGPFASNGNVITVIGSYAYTHRQTANSGTGGISGTGGATIVIERSTNSGSSWTTLMTLTATETERTVDFDPDPSVPDTIRWSMGASQTATWTPGAFTTLMLRARVTARSTPSFTGTGLGTPTITQDTGVQSTE